MKGSDGQVSSLYIHFHADTVVKKRVFRSDAVASSKMSVEASLPTMMDGADLAQTLNSAAIHKVPAGLMDLADGQPYDTPFIRQKIGPSML